MGNYRFIVGHVRYWRGAIHRWSNSFEFTGSLTGTAAAACVALQTQVATVCYSSSPGGIYETRMYNAGGGVPLATQTNFDWETPGSWIAYSGSGWAGTSASYEKAAEVALGVRWPAGFSSTGKPVFFRKWFHAIPQSAAASPGAVDITSAQITVLQPKVDALATCLSSGYGLVMGNGSRIASDPSTISPYYENHQMPRGRRRKPLVTASGRYTGPTITVPDTFPVEAD